MSTSKVWLVTGAAGFIGSALVRQLATVCPESAIRCVDYCASAVMQLNLGEVFQEHRQIMGIRSHYAAETVAELAADADYILHLAAETHVDTAIDEPSLCVENNFRELELFLRRLRQCGFSGRLVYVSTDEVYGDRAGLPPADERTEIRCSNVYAATKAGAEQLCLAYHRTHGMDVVITRGSNTYGLRQSPEKFVPRSLYLLSQGQPIQLYGQGKACREWLHVDEHASGIMLAAQKGQSGQIYNLAGRYRSSGSALAELLIRYWYAPEDPNKPGLSSEEVRQHIAFVPDRPGHDMDYRMNGYKVRVLGWNPPFDSQLQWRGVVQWYRANSQWLEVMRTHGIRTERLGLGSPT